LTNDYSLTCSAENVDYGDHGYLTVANTGDVITLRCHWPFDFIEDEWINIENSYHASSYLRAVDDALTSGWGSACGIAGGYLHITTLGDRFTLEFSRPSSGWSASSLRLRVDRPVSDLQPEVLPFRFAWETRALSSAA
jgi:hypothetical protein